MWHLGTCPYCKKGVYKNEDFEWVQKRGMNSKKCKKVYFHRSCYMKTTIGYHEKMKGMNV